MTSEQLLSASSTSFSVTIATAITIKNLQNWSSGSKMFTEKGKIYKTCSKWCPFIWTQAWSRFPALSPLLDGLINDCLSEVWPYSNQVLFQLVYVAYALLLNTVSKTAQNSVIDWI